MMWEIKPSPLHGFGLFAMEPIHPGELICSGGMTEHQRGTFDGTPLEDIVCQRGDKDIMTWGPHMWINHSDTPNCWCESDWDYMWDVLRAKHDIPVGEELTVDYRTICDSEL